MINNNIGKVLIVDDEVELKNVLVEALVSHGYDAVGFTSGADALAALRKQSFDVLVTDLMMPGMDGIALLREGLQIDPHLVAIVMTGQGTIQTAVDAMKVGAFDYVLKPFRLQTMLPVLTRAMNTRHIRLENLQLRETVAIYELAQTIAFTLDPQTVISKLADAALQQTDGDEVSVLLPSSDGSDQMYVAAVRGENRERLLGERVPLEESISGWVAREREPLILQGEIRDPRFRSLYPHPEICSSVSIPMQVANKLVGTININALNRPRPFTLGQMKALTILAGTAAAALESASLYSQVQQAEKNYRSIFEHSIEGIFQATREGKYLTANPAMARILGYDSPADLIASVSDLHTQVFVHPEACTEALALMDRQGSVKDFQIEAYRKDGEKIWLSMNIRAVRAETTGTTYCEGTIENITERKLTEEALKRSESHLAEAQRLASIGSWDWDLDTNVMTWSDEHYRIFGIKSMDIDVNDEAGVFAFIHAEDRSLVKREAEKAIKTKQPFNFYYRIVRKDGEERIIQSRGQVETDKQGRAIRMFGTAQDVTERRRMEQELRQSEERYRDLVENAHDIIYAHDLKGNYISMNKAGEQITGYSHDEALRLNLAQTVAPEDLPKARAMLARKLAGEQVTAYEMDIIAKDGRRITIEANTKLVTQDGVAVGVQGVARDITERKRMQEALRESEEQLRQSQKMEAIGQLAGGVAHDFNNLLTAINGYSSLALRRLGQEHPVTPHLEEIKKAGDRAANLTRQLLAFGRKQMLQPLALNVNEVVLDMSKMLKRLIGEDVQLITKLHPRLNRITADPGQLEQVVVNLVVNARDAMPTGGSLTIETANADIDDAYSSKHIGVLPGRYIMLAVSDTGIGMDHETQARIFEPFFTTKEKGKGTGLGLSTVYGIVKQSGGNIWVYSEVDKGTTFKVYLPQLQEAPQHPVDSAAESALHRGSETVLLVEDEEMVRNLTTELLRESGYRVLTANGGAEAVQVFKNHRRDIHLLITDVVMPKMSGKEVADKIRSIQPDTKVLFMSGYTDEAIVHHDIIDSGIAFIQKPFSEHALALKVREVLDAGNGHN